MPTQEEHLRQELGSVVAQLLIQNAMLKAEIDRLRLALAEHDVDHRQNPG